MKFRRTRGNGAARDEIFINLASLIDIIFVLLLFFVVTTTFTKQNQLKIDLPESSTHNPMVSKNSERLEISVSNDGRYAINGKALANNTEEVLSEALLAAAGNDRERPVLITADANAKYQAVITAMSVTGQLGFSKLRLVTVDPEK